MTQFDEREGYQTPDPWAGYRNAEGKFSIELFIAAIPWTPAATEYDKTLVAGNLRNLYAVLKPARDAAQEVAATAKDLADFVLSTPPAQGGTPRTDAAEKECHLTVNGAIVRGVVTDNFARQLERELAEAKRELHEVKEHSTAQSDDQLHQFMRAEKAEAALSANGEREAALQAKIDALMLEYCPEDMTPAQIENWKRHQRSQP